MTDTKKRYSVGIGSEYRVVRWDPEYADMDHPNGEIVDEVFFAIAEDENGNRWSWGGANTLEQAEFEYLHFAPPVEFGGWTEFYPVYGSKAWMQYGEADEMARESRQNEAEGWGLDTRFMLF